MRLGDLIDNRELTSEKSGYSVAWCVQVTDTWGVAHFFYTVQFSYASQGMFGLDECLLRYLHTVFEGIEKVYVICILSRND